MLTFKVNGDQSRKWWDKKWVTNISKSSSHWSNKHSNIQYKSSTCRSIQFEKSLKPFYSWWFDAVLQTNLSVCTNLPIVFCLNSCINQSQFALLKVLGYDTKSDMTSKYGTIFFIITRHYKWEDFEIDFPRFSAASKIFHAETGSNNSGRYTCCYGTAITQ